MPRTRLSQLWCRACATAQCLARSLRPEGCAAAGIHCWPVVVLIAVSLVGGCHRIESYRDESPSFQFRDFLDGKLTGWGVFSNRSGKIEQRFCIDMQAGWNEERGWLIEEFHFSDGRSQRREWSFEQLGPDQFTGRANDSVGTAHGQAVGPSMRWRYTLALPTDSFDELTLDFDYWMHSVDAGTVLNRAEISKYGLRLGDALVIFRREASACRRGQVVH